MKFIFFVAITGIYGNRRHVRDSPLVSNQVPQVTNQKPQAGFQKYGISYPYPVLKKNQRIRIS